MLFKTLKILLIEEKGVEVVRLNKAISKEFKDYKIILAKNGNEALSILKSSLVDIIITDLNMSDPDGIEFLSSLKSNLKLKHIPIIILTTSKNDKDIKNCYKLGISGYLLKSLKYEDYKIKINTILRYWSLNEFI
jgi:CheY-like chemotaxis protein